MQEFLSLSDIQFERPSVVAIGFFDGMHRAHQKIIETCVEKAHTRDAQSVVFTFQNHPSTLFTPDRPIPLLMPFALKRQWMSHMQIDTLAAVPFDESISQTNSHEFINTILKQRLNAVEIVVGFNFLFGHRRQGSVRTLQEAVPDTFEHVTVIDQQHWEGHPISSTAIRQYLQDGSLKEAQNLLGHPFQLMGTVILGDGRGRSIGFPTANIDTGENLLPPNGVYGVRVYIGSFDTNAHWGVMNIGTVPTFGEKPEASVEVHLLDYEGDLYGKCLIVELLEHIREERKFPGVDQLMKTIRQDIDTFRQHISHHS